MEPEIKVPTKVIVQVNVVAPLQKVWQCWTEPQSIVKWNHASDDWHTPMATNDLRVGGKFLSRMEAKDGSFGFDFEGVYDLVEINKCIQYTLGDGRQVKITFAENGNTTQVTETFDAENINSIDLQKTGWQSILNSFKKYTERV